MVDSLQQAYQYLCNRRHAIGSAALAQCISLFVGLPQEAINEEITVLLNKNSFIYGGLKKDDPLKAFHGDLIIQMLAKTYLPNIAGHIHVNELTTKDIVYCGIKGILGLCSVVVSFFSLLSSSAC